jgi:hemoglobin-like flavoprotein
MTPAQVQLVRDGFQRLAADRDGLAADFYARLFALEPSLRALFQSDLKAQGAKLVGALAYVVKGLDRLDEILDDVRALGRRHVAYGVQPSDYDVVGRALIGTLAARLGESFDARAQAAWTAAYSMLAAAMIEAASVKPPLGPELARSAA